MDDGWVVVRWVVVWLVIGAATGLVVTRLTAAPQWPVMIWAGLIGAIVGAVILTVLGVGLDLSWLGAIIGALGAAFAARAVR